MGFRNKMQITLSLVEMRVLSSMLKIASRHQLMIGKIGFQLHLDFHVRQLVRVFGVFYIHHFYVPYFISQRLVCPEASPVGHLRPVRRSANILLLPI